jgi:hypothetical protein
MDDRRCDLTCLPACAVCVPKIENSSSSLAIIVVTDVKSAHSAAVRTGNHLKSKSPIPISILSLSLLTRVHYQQGPLEFYA